MEATLETSLNALFLKQLQVLRSNAIATFKSSLNDESPTDFVFYQVDSAFRREAEESVMPGSSWSYEAEHNFLQSFMEDAANARKRLLDVQVSVSLTSPFPPEKKRQRQSNSHFKTSTSKNQS